MPKFKIGDKVYVRRDVQTGVSPRFLDHDRAYTIISKWPNGSLVLDGGLEAFAFAVEWLLPASSDAGFKVGDKVWFLPEEATKVDPHNCWVKHVDPHKLYTITRISPEGDSIWIDDGGWDFVYSTNWLKKAEEYNGEFKVKISEGRIKDVKFSGPATIVFWTDGTKTVVKCRKGDKFDPEKGIAMACAKKLLGNEDGYHKEIAKYIDKNAAETLRKEAYKLCGKTKCESCPAKCLFGECPNFLQLGTSELRKLVRAMQEAPKYGDS